MYIWYICLQTNCRWKFSSWGPDWQWYDSVWVDRPGTKYLWKVAGNLCELLKKESAGSILLYIIHDYILSKCQELLSIIWLIRISTAFASAGDLAYRNSNDNSATDFQSQTDGPVKSEKIIHQSDENAQNTQVLPQRFLINSLPAYCASHRWICTTESSSTKLNTCCEPVWKQSTPKSLISSTSHLLRDAILFQQACASGVSTDHPELLGSVRVCE